MSALNPIAPTPIQSLSVQTTIPGWQQTSSVIAEIAFRILIPLATCFLLYSALPVGLAAFAVPFAAIGLSFATAFLFNKPAQGIQLKPQLPPSAMAPHAPRGLLREGNNCWLNSLLQLLRKDRPLMDWIQNNEAGEPLRHFYESYQGTYEHNWSHALTSTQPMREFIAGITNQIPPSCATQQDPTEGLQILYHLIPDNQKAVIETTIRLDTTGLPDILDNPQAVIKLTSRNPGLLPVEMSVNGEEPGAANLLDLIPNSLHGTDHDPDGIDRMGVDGVMHRYKPIDTTYRFTEAPAACWVQLKRFIYPGEAIKIGTPVTVPDRAPFPIVDGAAPEYELDSFLVHRGPGNTPHMGHYISYVKENGEWFELNDHVVTRLTAEQAERAKSIAYLLHFTLQQAQ